jgi:hypothetical protein
MSSEEAAWYLLRQPMLEASRDIINIPMCWPHKRQKTRKMPKHMEEEHLTDDSTDVWYNIVQKHEKRPMESMANVMLADFATEYTLKQNGEYKKRDVPHILCCRHYDMGEIVDYKQEVVLLYWPFQNETLDILDHNKFIEIYDENEAQILGQRHKYQSNLDINKTMEYCRQLCVWRWTMKLRHSSGVKPT